jgi:hypothetical protein
MATRRPRPADELSGRRRAYASVALAVASALIVLAGLSELPGVSTASRATRPLTAGLGLEQHWNVFAPRPRRDGLRIEAAVAWSDGARTTWTIPTSGPALGAYRDYRWRKWSEHASSTREGPWLWEPAVWYVARTLPARGSAVPLEVRLYRYTRPVAPPGAAGSGVWGRTEVYRARLEERRP